MCLSSLTVPVKAISSVCVLQFIVEPRSSAQLGVRFSPSAIGEGNHAAKITFTCPQVYINTHKHKENGLYKSLSPALTHNSIHIGIVHFFFLLNETAALVSFTASSLPIIRTERGTIRERRKAFHWPVLRFV